MPAPDVAQTQRAPQAVAQTEPMLFGGRKYDDLLSEMNTVLGVRPDAAPIADASVRSVGALKEVTFSVASSDTSPSFGVVHYDEVSRATYNRTVPTASITEPFGSGEFQLSVRRENGRDIYTVRTTPSFVGALKVESSEGTLMVYTHGAASEETQAAATQTAATPAAASPPPATLPPVATPPTATPLSETALASIPVRPQLTRMERRTEIPAEQRILPSIEPAQRPMPEPFTPERRAPESFPTPEIEMPRPQLARAELDSTRSGLRPAEIPGEIEMPPPPERRPEATAARPQRSGIRSSTPDPIERPETNLPTRERVEFTYDPRPVAPLPGEIQPEIPTLARSGTPEIEIRLAPAAPSIDFPLPEEFKTEPESRPPTPRERSNLRRPELAERGPEQPSQVERPPRSEMPDPFRHTPAQMPLPDVPVETPQLAVITAGDSPIRRAPAPAEPIEGELGVPDERARQQQTAQTTRPPSRPEKREESELDREIADVATRRAKAEREREALARKLQNALEANLKPRQRENRFFEFQNFLNADDMTLPTEQWADRVLTATGNSSMFGPVLDFLHTGTKHTLMPDFQRYRLLRHNIGELDRTNTRLQGLRAAESPQGTPSSR